MECSIRIGGAAGQGMQFIGSILAKYFSRVGLHVFCNQDYMSRIRGGHNFYQIRVANAPLAASRGTIDLLVALNQECIEIHQESLHKDGIVLYDSVNVGQSYSGRFLDISLQSMAEEHAMDKIMVNSITVGAVIGVLGLEVDRLLAVIEDVISVPSKSVLQTHFTAAQAGFKYVSEQIPAEERLTPLYFSHKQQGLMLINGNQAIGLGALVSGCKFYAAYPMTPSTSIMLYMADKAKKHGVVVEQAEDEIAAINMALGASYAGVRAMTGTSGGGFALMCEGVSLSGITETPVVIAEVQRPGPATGLPTRTEQGDLFFTIFGGHGEFPRVVFTPGTPEQAFLLTCKAFHLAEKYQIPVIVQSDQYLADSGWTFSELDTGQIQYTDFRLKGEALNKLDTYSRYAFTETGISPMAVPGESPHLVVVDSDEHDQDGHIIEDALTRNKMVKKRLHSKMALLQQEISPPSFYGNEKPEIILVGFGSTYGVIKETVDHFFADQSIAMLHFSEVFPFPALKAFDYLLLLKKAKLSLCIENNGTSQFAKLMRMETGYIFSATINKFDGRPFVLEDLIGDVHDHIRRI